MAFNWTFPVARFIADTVYAASKQVYDLAKSEANQERFKWAVAQARPMVITGLTESLGLARVGLLKMFGVWGPLVEQVVETLVEAAYQAMKAAAETKYITNSWGDADNLKAILKERDSFTVETPPVNPPAPESVVEAPETAEQAEPGNESMESDHAIGFHAIPYVTTTGLVN
jgi:hypothetical protein